jgi:vancomycin resistance protein YoaR
VPNFSSRDDWDLYAIARLSVLGEPDNLTAPLFSPETAQTVTQISSEVNQSAHNAQLVISNQRATTFDPGQNGQTLDSYQLRALLLDDGTTAVLPVIVAQPQVKLADTNDLGINTLVAEGISDFSGSPHNRIINIGVGATKFNGIIVAAGAEFSFNHYLGEVDAAHGFLPELVIKPDGVTPEFGGGLCQVSTTTFRAAMNAGLPITARRNHSFAVQYYAPQGTDATIYPGSADLKFINNLSSPLLIATRIIGRKLYFDFYGTPDNRKVSFDGPTVFDKKTNGAMKATWTRHVDFNGQITTQVFNSKYLPPALFHPVIPPPVPAPTPEPPPLTQ